MAEPHEEQAIAYRQEVAQAARAIRADEDLTPDAQARKLDELRRSANDRFAALRREHETALDEEIRGLRRKALGPVFRGDPEKVDTETVRMSYRQAQDRAEQLDGQDDALRLLLRAEDSDDVQLVRAIAARAHARGWPKVLAEHARIDPRSAKAQAELDERRALRKDNVRLSTTFGMGLMASENFRR